MLGGLQRRSLKLPVDVPLNYSACLNWMQSTLSSPPSMSVRTIRLSPRSVSFCGSDISAADSIVSVRILGEFQHDRMRPPANDDLSEDCPRST